MIRIHRPPAAAVLPPGTRAALVKRQKRAKSFPAGDPRIGKAWASFLGSGCKEDVANAMDRCFRFKCAYCEGVVAQDIEHFYPKTIYPERMFDWENLLRGCKNCNNFKRDHFPLQDGKPLLLDPCQDEPLDYLAWDFETGATGVRPEPEFERRGTTTRELLRLDLEPLREERRKKLALVVYLLARIVNENPLTLETKERLKVELDESRPWLGIVRQLYRRPGPTYEILVSKARAILPEIDEWITPWF